MGSRRTEIVRRSLKKNTIVFRFRLTRSTTGDVIARLESKGTQKTAYIVRLIREDIAREKAGSEKED